MLGWVLAALLPATCTLVCSSPPLVSPTHRRQLGLPRLACRGQSRHPRSRRLYLTPIPPPGEFVTSPSLLLSYNAVALPPWRWVGLPFLSLSFFHLFVYIYVRGFSAPSSLLASALLRQPRRVRWPPSSVSSLHRNTGVSGHTSKRERWMQRAPGEP